MQVKIKEKNIIINNSSQNNPFVGIQVVNDQIYISFPQGYHISEEKSNLIKDIKLLLKTISDNRITQTIDDISLNNGVSSFPLMSYINVIKYYIHRGIYNENSCIIKKSKTGKISWKRTLKKVSPQISNDSIIYLSFLVKKQKNISTIITDIYKYCLNLAIQNIGWLYNLDTNFHNQISTINIERYLLILKSRYKEINNDENKNLILSLIKILEEKSNNKLENTIFLFGTYHFEYIWEKLINNHFGIKNKEKYFPKTYWILSGNLKFDNSKLEPDTLMITSNNEIIIIDAKYYKYGITKKTNHLPMTSSISKQIIYGEYTSKVLGTDKVYNVFLMPYDNGGQANSIMEKIGYAYSEWKDNEKPYEIINGVIIDTKYIMQHPINNRKEDQETLRNCIIN